MADLRFKVGAAIDPSWDVVFGSIVQKANKARKRIADEMQAGGKSLGGAFNAGAGQAGTALAKVGSAAKETGDKARTAGVAMGRMADGARERFEMLERGLRKLPADLSTVAREAERELARIERAQARSALGLGSGGGGGGSDKFGRRVGYWSVRNFSPVTPTLAIGANIARDFVRGVGIDSNLGSLVGHGVESESLAAKLSIQGLKSWAKDDDPAKHQVAGSTLQSEAKKIGNDVFMDPNEILRAQTRFVDLTGDLATARGVMGQLGKVANATGADMQDMASAAAAISVSLDASFGSDKAGKIKAMDDILRNLAAQGKEGAVEIKQYASQMSKLTAAVGEIGGDRVEAFNLAGMLVQESRKRGGSTTATQAATSVTAFVRDLEKDAASKHPHIPFDVFNRDAKGNRTSLQSPSKIIEAAVLQSQGDPVKLRKMFPNSMSFRAVEGFALTYRAAEAAHPGSGKAALEDEIATLHSAVLSQQDVENANLDLSKTTKAKAQLFQNQLYELTEKMSTQVLPAMEKAGPGLIEAAGHISSFVAWAAGNPWEAAGVALGASVAKAGIEQSLRGGIEKLLATRIGGFTVNSMAVTATAVAMYQAGKAAIDSEIAGYNAADRGAVANSLAGSNVAGRVNTATRNGKALTPEEMAGAERARAQLQAQLAQEEAGLGSGGTGLQVLLGGLAEAFGTPDSKGGSKTATEMQDAEYRKQLEEARLTRAALERLTEALDRNRGNHAPPSVDGGARANSTPLRPGFAPGPWR